MNDYNNGVIGGNADTDLGLKTFMLGTYRWMALAMLVTAGTAYFFGTFILTPQIAQFLFGNIIVSLALVGGIIFGFSAVGRKLPSMSMGGVLTFLFAMAAVLGVMASTLVYRDPTIVAKVFFMTTALFAALSMFGYTTKTNLTPFIKFAAIGFGIFVAYMLLSMAIPAIAPTGMMQTVVFGGALILISVLAAGETQMLKRIYYSMGNDTVMLNKMSAFAAASLLLTFYNMFQLLMALFGRE